MLRDMLETLKDLKRDFCVIRTSENYQVCSRNAASPSPDLEQSGLLDWLIEAVGKIASSMEQILEIHESKTQENVRPSHQAGTVRNNAPPLERELPKDLNDRNSKQPRG